ncbi:MAG: hypothetical protein H0W20_15460 [Chthoniobacterales bacterium]|nr:hypothetical protein [Chthoniobacterales bacterium]
MKNLLRLLGFGFCFLAAHTFAGMVEAPASTSDIDPLGFEFDVQGTYVGEGDVERGSRRIDDFDEFQGLARFLILPRTPVGILRLGAEYEIYDFDIAEGLQVPDRLQSIAAIIGLDTKLSDSFLIRFEAKPGFYSADDIEGRDFNAPFILGGTYLYSSTLQFVFGVGVDYEGEFPVIPGGGIRWKFAPQWVLNAVVPTPRLEYEMSRNLTLYVGADLKSKNFRVDDDFVGDAREPANLNNAMLRYTEIRTGIGAIMKLGETCKIALEGGYLPYREFDYYRADIRYKADGGAPYGSISLSTKF